MNRPLLRLTLAFTILLVVTAGFFEWKTISAHRAWAAIRPDLPTGIDHSSPGLETRLAACVRRMDGWPLDHAALAEFAKVCHANGLLDSAIVGYQALLNLEPNNARWPHLLALILAGYGRLDEALPLLRQTVKLAPDYTVAWLNLGDALLKSNATADAEAAYREALRREPDNPYALLGIARCDLQSDRLTAARSHLQQAAASHPDFAGAQSLLATVFERLGNPEAAAVARERVQNGGHYTEPPDPWAEELLLDCHNPYTLVVAASAAVADGKPAKAIPLLERGLKLAPDDARLHRQYGKTLAILGDISGARHQLEQAVALAPTNDSIQLDLLAILRRAQDTVALERAIENGLTACPASPGLHFEAGVIAANAGRLDEATKHLEFSWRNGPDQSAAALELANVHFKSGRDEAGVAVLEEVLARHPQETAALVVLIRHGIETGNPQTAEWLKRAIDANAPPALLAELRQNYQRRFGAVAP